MRRPLVVFVTLLILVMSHTGWGGVDYFPQDDFIPGWKAYPTEEYRNAEELYMYMNGGAELYLEYRYAGLKVKEFAADDGGSLTVEIYSYAEPWDAFGIFSVDTTGAPVDIGEGGRQSGVITRFWKGNYYVRVFVWESKPEYAGIPETAAREVEAKITSSQEFPLYLTQCIKHNLPIAFIRGEIALRQVAGNWNPGEISFDRKEGGAWALPEPPDQPGCLILSYRSEERMEREYENIWNRITSNATSYAQGKKRGFAYDSNELVDGLEKYQDGVISAIIWAPQAKDETICAEAIDRIKDALSIKED